ESSGPMQSGDLAKAMPDADGGRNAEFLQRVQSRQRSSDDRWLSDVSGDAVAIRRQLRLRVKLASEVEAARVNAAAEIRGRALAGKEKANPRRIVAAGEEDSVLRIDNGLLSPTPEGSGRDRLSS